MKRILSREKWLEVDVNVVLARQRFRLEIKISLQVVGLGSFTFHALSLTPTASAAPAHLVYFRRVWPDRPAKPIGDRARLPTTKLLRILHMSAIAEMKRSASMSTVKVFTSTASMLLTNKSSHGRPLGFLSQADLKSLNRVAFKQNAEFFSHADSAFRSVCMPGRFPADASNHNFLSPGLILSLK